MGRGRKSRICTEIIDRIAEALATGATFDIASKYGGISRNTLYEWMKRGELAKSGIFQELHDKINKALGEGAVHNLQNVHLAAKKGDWKASAWILERRHGYRRDGSAAATKEAASEELPKDPLEILKQQAKELKKTMAKAESSQSWQAYAALQRQFLTVVMQIRQIGMEDGSGDEMDGLTDEQLLSEITNAIVSLPPILRQRLESNFADLSNVIEIGKNKQ